MSFQCCLRLPLPTVVCLCLAICSHRCLPLPIVDCLCLAICALRCLPLPTVDCLCLSLTASAYRRLPLPLLIYLCLVLICLLSRLKMIVIINNMFLLLAVVPTPLACHLNSLCLLTPCADPEAVQRKLPSCNAPQSGATRSTGWNLC